MKYIVKNSMGHVLTCRKATGRLYESRAGWSGDMDDCKVFDTKSAAVNSARRTGENEFKVYPVFIQIGDEA